MKRRILLAALPSLVAARALAQAPVMLEAQQAWSRPALARIGTAVVYLTLRNGGSRPVRVTGGSTPVAERVEIHESTVENGLARMRPRPDGVIAPPGGVVRFEPSGLHLMLLKPHADLKAGQTFPLTLSFDTGETLTVSVSVSMREPAAGHGGMNH
jgi:copper(I)-binding protein